MILSEHIYQWINSIWEKRFPERPCKHLFKTKSHNTVSLTSLYHLGSQIQCARPSSTIVVHINNWYPSHSLPLFTINCFLSTARVAIDVSNIYLLDFAEVNLSILQGPLDGYI